MVHVPTCLIGSGLVRHSLVPDLLEPALAHHGLEPGLASQWARELYQRVLHHPHSFQLLVGRCQDSALSMITFGSKSKLIFAKSVTRQLNYLVRRGSFLVELSHEFSPTEQDKQDQ